MTPAEFRSVHKGYALALADQRQQIMFGRQVPQLTSPVELKDDLNTIIGKISEDDAHNIKKMLTDGKVDQSKLTSGQQLFMKAIQDREKR